MKVQLNMTSQCIQFMAQSFIPVFIFHVFASFQIIEASYERVAAPGSRGTAR